MLRPLAAISIIAQHTFEMGLWDLFSAPKGKMDLMDNMDNINTMLENVLKSLGTLLAILIALGQLIDKLKPALRFLAFLGTQIIPNLAIIWLWLYVTAQYADRLTEPAVFLSLVGQETVLIVIYNLFWAIWIYPKMKPWLPKFLLADKSRGDDEVQAANIRKKKKTN